MKLIVGPDRYEEAKSDAEGMTMYGKPIKEMDRDELLVVIGLLVGAWENSNQELKRRTEFLLS